MSIDAQADNFNQDGSITLKVDGKDTKYVKESDLGAVKGAAETAKGTYEGQISVLQTNLATANTAKDESHQNLLKERTAKEQFENEAKESATHKTRVGELETEVTGLKESSGQLRTKLTDRIRGILTEGYKVDAEKIKDMALEDLEKTEGTLLLTGAKPAPANYDGKDGGGTPPAMLGVLEQSSNEIKLARQLQQKRREGSDPDDKP